jgi:NADH-quinone oxidoreductase subunit J
VNGEALAFWMVAPVTVIGALGLVLSRKAVHAALWLALTMVGLAILYAVLSAPFLAVVQVIVYTGAVMMLFLFVIMLVGVDASDSLVETLRGQRVAGLIMGVGLAVLLGAVVRRATLPSDGVVPDGQENVTGLAELMLGDYLLAFEATAALLITAALGALILTHRERFERRPTQRELATARFRPPDGDLSGAAGLPSPGVYARHNAVDTPALLPDGTPAPSSLSRVLVARDAVLQAPERPEDVERLATGAAVTVPEPVATGTREPDVPPSADPDGGEGQPR